MVALPKKRILVYAVAGLVVLAVGAAGLMAARPSTATSPEGIVVDLSGAAGMGNVEADDAGGGGGPDATGLGSRPAMTSTTQAQALMFVQVAGAVARPGVYQMPDGSRAFQAILQAGGFTGDADQEIVPLASRLTDGCRLYVPKKGETLSGPVLMADPDAPGGSTGSGGLVPINSATAERLDTLPGIGPSLAQQIIRFRETKGPFTSVDQLGDVPGIGPSKLEQLRPLVTL